MTRNTRWLAAGFAMFAAACGGSTEPSGPGGGASQIQIVSGNGQVQLVGQPLPSPLIVKVVNGSGAPVVGATVTFTVASGSATVSPASATTDATGQAKTQVTLGSSPGNVQINAKVGGTSLVVAFVVTAGTSTASRACTGATPAAMAVGQVTTGVTGSGVCLSGGTSGADFAIIAFHANPDSSAIATVNVTSQNAVSLTTADVAPSFNVLTAGAGSALTTGRSFSRYGTNPVQRAFDLKLRQSARRELAPKMAAAREWMRNRAHFNVVPTGALTLGQVITLNANGNPPACSNPINIGGRVAAISQTAYVIADTANPAGGFTDAEYQSFATTFDTLVDPVDVQNFGTPSDIDKNGKIIILFTKEVNKQTPRGSNGVVAGFFYERDLFPTVGNGDLDGCPSSNVSEMYYALVPDPNGVYSDRRSKADVLDFTTSTLAHEYQHLINAGRRLYVTIAPTFEDTWLNEGLSHIAEELLYFKATKLAPRQNLDVNAVIAAGSDAFSEFQGGNIGRLEEFLSRPSSTSVYGGDDELETRGATWDLLRYLADHKGSSDGDTWFQLVNNTTHGQDNLRKVFGADYMTQIRNWAISVFTDDVTGVSDNSFLEQSWNMRSIFPRLLDESTGRALGKYPLAIVPLSDATPANLAIVAGGEAYLRFSVPGGTAASIDWAAGGLPVSPLVQFAVVRTR
jgi:hypothetical protein